MATAASLGSENSITLEPLYVCPNVGGISQGQKNVIEMSDRDLLGREIEGLSKNRPARLYILQWLQILPELAF